MGEAVSAADSARSWRRIALHLSWILPGAIYGMTAARDVALVDSGELVLAASGPGVAHAPGFPVWVMLGWIASRIPGSEIVHVNFLSALAGTVTVHLVYRLARHWLTARDGRMPGPAASEFAPLSGAMLAAFAFPIWGFAGFAEVYTVTSALLVGALLATSHWREAPSDGRLLTAGVLWGLAASCHHITAGLALPAMIWLVASRRGRDMNRWRNVGVAAVAATAVGLFCYGSILVIGRTDPWMNWGGVKDLERLFWHVTGKQYRVNLLTFRPEGLLLEAKRLSWLALVAWTPPGIVLAVRGWRRIAKTRPPEAIALALLAGLGLVFAFCYEIAEDKEAYYATATWAIGLAFAAGLLELMARKDVRSRRFGIALAVVVPLAVAGMTVRAADRHADGRARAFVEDVAGAAGPDGILLTQEWQFYSPWLALHHLEGFRPDLRVVDVNLVRRSWYLDYLRREMPEVMECAAVEEAAFREQLDLFERDRPYDPATIQASFLAFLNAL
ncbi:MAG: DUF2723 domain-containing protein, partial [Gemmatimonadota bacterium]|nr:DUF2723 domain-containing protein [Gemmatimonadota bacterium]